MKRPRALLGLGRPYACAVLVDGGRAAARSSAPPPAGWRRRGTRTATYATLLQLDKTDARWRCELRQILRSSAQLQGWTVLSRSQHSAPPQKTPEEPQRMDKGGHAEGEKKGGDAKREARERHARETIWTVPNLITLTRIGCSPLLSWLILEGRYLEAVAGVVIAGATDVLDGYIARNYNQQSVLGGFLDPLADKILVAAISLPLAYQGHIPVPLLAVVFGRDLLLVAGSFIKRALSRPPGSPFFDTTSTATFEIKPNTLSKINTGMQFGVLSMALSRALWDLPGPEIFEPFCWLVGSTTVISGLMYLGGDGTASLKKGLRLPGRLGMGLGLKKGEGEGSNKSES